MLLTGKRPLHRGKKWMEYRWNTQRLNTPYGYAFFIIIAALISYILTHLSGATGLLILGGIVGGAITFYSVINAKAGFYFILVLSFFLFYFKRMWDSFPTGTITDILTIATFSGLLLKKIINRNESWSDAKNPITYIYLIYFVYLALEVLNPNGAVFAGWFFFFRKVIIQFLFYFIALHVFDSPKSIKTFFKWWLALALLTAIYGCYQKWFGLLGFEYRWELSSPKTSLFQMENGNIRIFSFLSDPPAFGVVMSISAIFCIVLSFGPFSRKKKLLLLISSIPMLLGMAYSGTRSATAMIPAGILLYCLMSIHNKKTLLFLISFLIGLAVLVYGPFYGNSTINRVRSAFQPKEDASMTVRNVNRKHIQPYIHSHPIGGGIATVGGMGMEYNPHHPLAGFPPDSAYLNEALEIGWIGLALVLIMYFTILKIAVTNYYKSTVPEFRIYYAGIAAVFFAWVVADYAQQATGQFTNTYIYFPLLAAIVKLRRFEIQPEGKSVLQ